MAFKKTQFSEDKNKSWVLNKVWTDNPSSTFERRQLFTEPPQLMFNQITLNHCYIFQTHREDNFNELIPSLFINSFLIGWAICDLRICIECNIFVLIYIKEKRLFKRFVIFRQFSIKNPIFRFSATTTLLMLRQIRPRS